MLNVNGGDGEPVLTEVQLVLLPCYDGIKRNYGREEGKFVPKTAVRMMLAEWRWKSSKPAVISSEIQIQLKYS